MILGLIYIERNSNTVARQRKRYKDKLIVQCINSLPALPILAYNFDDLDRDQPKILVSFAMPVCHVMQTYRLIVKASKIFETNYHKMR